MDKRTFFTSSGQMPSAVFAPGLPHSRRSISTYSRERLHLMLYGLAIVVVTFGVMAAIAIPKVLAGVATLKVTMCDYRFKMLNAAIEIYKIDTGSYPDNLKQIVRDPLYFTLGEPYCVWGDVFSYNANTHRIVPHNHKRRYNWRELLDLY